MTLKLDFPIDCIAKELELAHRAFLAESNATHKRQLGQQLQSTITKLNAYIQCDCRDPTCPHYQLSRCSCHNVLSCKQIGFMVDSFHDGDDGIVAKDFERFQIVLTDQDRVRQPDETFIAYKVRLASRVRDAAVYVRTARNVGQTRYSYASWNDTTSADRETHFKAFIADLRHTTSEDDLGQVVGCLQCGKTFKTEENLFAHVDRYKFLEDFLHINTAAKMVTADSVVEVRPSPPYQLPPIPENPNTRHEVNEPTESIDQFMREYVESSLDYKVRFRRYLRDQHDERARGCELCGLIFPNEDMTKEHIMEAHSLGPSSARTCLVVPALPGPEPEDPEQEQESENSGPYDEERDER